MTALASHAVNELAKMTDFVNVVINVSFISLDKLTSVEEGPPACYRLTSCFLGSAGPSPPHTDLQCLYAEQARGTFNREDGAISILQCVTNSV